MNLTFIPDRKNIAVAFEPGATAFKPGAVPPGSRKAPPPRFFSEVRLNPDAQALILRPRAILTRYATEWPMLRQPDGCVVYVIEDCAPFGNNIYTLMGWDRSRAYTIPGTLLTGSFLEDLATCLRNRVSSDDVAQVIASPPDSARIGDYYFNLKEAETTLPTGQILYR